LRTLLDMPRPDEIARPVVVIASGLAVSLALILPTIRHAVLLLRPDRLPGIQVDVPRTVPDGGVATTATSCRNSATATPARISPRASGAVPGSCSFSTRTPQA